MIAEIVDGVPVVANTAAILPPHDNSAASARVYSAQTLRRLAHEQNDDELNNLGRYRIVNADIPPGMARTGEPRLVIRGQVVVREWDLVEIEGGAE